MVRISAIAGIGLSLIGLIHPAAAQMVTTSAPLHSVGSSFFESNSIGWSLQGKNWFADFGGGGPLLPPFGGNSIASGLRGGVGFAGGGVRGSLGFNFAQGSRQTLSSTTPSLTTMNGYPGSFFAGSVQPFVVGFVPVVGDYAAATAPLEAAEETASRIRQHQISSLRQSQASLHQRKLVQYLRRAEQGEAMGNKRMARANYRLAISIAPEPLRSELVQRLAAMMSTPAKELENGIKK